MAADDFDFRRARRVLERIPGEVNRELKAALRGSGEDFRSAMIGRFTGYATPRTSEDKMQNRRGNLRRSFNYVVDGDFGGGTPLTLLAFSAGQPYARLQEFGGVVTPKRAKYLTIPTAGNLKASGEPRFPSARDFIEQHPGETFFLRPKTGGRDGLLLMWQKPNPASRKSSGVKGKDEAIPMFFLTKKVTVPPRLGLRKTWASLAPDRQRRIREGIDKALKAAQA